MSRFNNETSYFPEIDALRAIAILAVVATHVTTVVPGGFFGVDVFFVVSGFLITYSSLVGERFRSFSIARFWRRRIARIMPALLAVTVVTTIIAQFLLVTEEDHRWYFGSLVFQAVFLQNFFFSAEGTNYFRGLIESKLNLHLWSIAIEEQFYLLFPLVVGGLICLVRMPYFAIAVVAAVISVGSFGLPLAHKPAGAVYYLTQYRIWQLGLGVLVASFVLAGAAPRFGARATLALEVVGLALISYSIFALGAESASRPAAMLVVCGAAALLISIAATGRSWLLRTAGSFSPVAAVGRASYSIYLWHWPVFATLKYLAFDFGHSAIDFGLYFLLLGPIAWSSYHLFEVRLRRLAYNHAAYLLSGFVVVAASASRLSPSTSAEVASLLHSASYPLTCTSVVCEHGRGEPGILLWGDSHARSLWQVVSQIGDSTGRKVYGVFSCMPGRRDDRCAARYQAAIELVRNGLVDHILLVSRWSVYAVGFPPYETEESGQRFFSHSGRTATTQSEMADIWRQSINDLATDLAGKRVHVMLQVPQFPFFPINEAIIDARGLRWRALPIKKLGEHRAEHEAVNRHFRSIQNFDLVDPAEVLCPDGECRHRNTRGILYKDDDHLSVTGAALLRDALQAVLR